MNLVNLKKCGLLLSAFGILGVGACAQSTQLNADKDPSDPSILEAGGSRGMLKQIVGYDSARGGVVSPNITAHLVYYGGKVVQNAKVIKVLYGSGTYASFVTGTGAGTSVASFFKGVTSSLYFGWLTEYNTSNPAQVIGLGTYGGSVTITPATSRNGATISDSQLQAELSAQMTAGHLAAPTNNTIYMVFFPKGKHITQGGSRSCVSGGFCAYHGTFKRNSQNVYYGVLPDMSAGSGCDTGCGTSTPFGNQTSVASHELIEAVTDPGYGLATVFGPPLAWYDQFNGEIGDICTAIQGSLSTSTGTYTVQKEWSNQKNACIVHK